MAYAKLTRVVRIDLADAGEPGLWVDVEHPESMSWRTKRAIIAANAETDELTRSMRQVASMVMAWNLTDLATDEVISTPIAPEAFDRLPGHVVEAILTGVGALFEVPKASESAPSAG